MPEKRAARTVLVVDDEANLRKIVSRLLENSGYRVLSAGNGKEAVKVFQAGGPVDLVILDVMMPEMDGYETLAKLKALGGQTPHVVMLTAKQEDGDIIKGYQVGADYYVTKPFKAERVLNVVNYLIGDLPPAERAELETRL